MGAGTTASAFELDAIATPVWVYDLDAHRIVRANAAAVALWGAPDAETLATRDFSVGMTEGVRQRLAAIGRRLSDGAQLRETWTLFPDDRPVALSCFIRAFRLEHGGRAMLVEAHPLEDEGELQDRRSVEALRHASVSIMLVDVNGTLVTGNALASSLFPDLAEGRPVTTILRDPAARSALEETMRWRQSYVREVCVITADGERWVALDARPLPDPATGQPAYLLSLVDVTERRRLEDEQRSYDKTLLSLLDTAPVPLVVTSPVNGRLLYANDETAGLFGLPVPELVGEPVTRFYADPAERSLLLDALADSGEVDGLELHIRAANGRAVPAWVSARLMMFNGEPAIVSALVDVEAERRARETIASALDKQLRINEVQRRFVSLLSHEFRTPLSIIDGAAQRVGRKAGKMAPEDIAQWMGRVRAAAARMEEMATDVLALARAESGQLTLDAKPVDVTALLSGVLDRHKGLSHRHELVLEADGLPETVPMDEKLIEIVLSNLLGNAIKYSPEGGQVRLTATASSERLRIAVADRGVGIPADELDRVFDRFYRCTTAAGISGTGLGLDIARQLVEMHGGAVGVTSRPGEGSVFTIELPLTAAGGATT